MNNNIKKIADEAKELLEKIKTSEELEKFRIKYLGRKSEISQVLKSLKDLPQAARKKVGATANKLKNELEQSFKEKLGQLGAGGLPSSSKSAIDVTLPGFRPERGRLHPITQVLNEVKAIEPVRGSSCDLLVQVEAPIRVIMTAHKIMAMKWLERLNVLTVEPVEVDEHQRQSRETLEKLKIAWARRHQPVQS